MPVFIPFGWFYLINLLIGTVFLTVYGYRKKYPLSTWLTVVACLMLLFIAGIKLMGYPFHSWPELIANSGGEQAFSKFVPGGVLFFILGFLAIKRVLKFRTSVMDSMILIIPWMLVVQRTGCFINGCCFGKPSGLPWAVTYPAGTSAFDYYLSTGTIHSGELTTCTLHPAQLYMVLGAILIWIVILRTRHLWKSPGSRALFGILLLGILRFIMESFRATPVQKWYAQPFLGLNYLQWIIALLAIIFTAALIRNEKMKTSAKTELPLNEDLFRTSVLLLSAIFLLWNLRRIFEFQELLLLQLLVSAAVVVTVYKALVFSHTRTSLAIVLILLVAFTTMSQEVIKTESDSLKNSPASNWFNFTVSGSTGRYEHRMRNCSGEIYDRELMSQTSGGIDASYHYKKDAKNEYDFGVRTWISDINNLSNYLDSGYTTYGLNPYVNYISPGFAAGMGLHVYRSAYWPYTALYRPSIYLRIGRENNFFVDGGLLDQMPVNGYLSFFHIGMGSGFKTNGKAVLRTGVAFSGFDNSDIDDDANFYLMGDFRLGDRFFIKPGIYFGNKAFGSLGLSYNFPSTTRKLK